jgi:hypothetical protein
MAQILYKLADYKQAAKIYMSFGSQDGDLLTNLVACAANDF